jgi:ubiquinone biosynthesis monooxygenase Coq7
MSRNLSFADRLVTQLDQGLRTVFGPPLSTGRPNPTLRVPEGVLDDAQRRESARLMRVNHTGEICAQALYQGQALTARLGGVREQMQKAADEENDHLAWCQERIAELGSHTSALNPLFYASSFSLGALAGLAGDRWSLGFVAETEHQVVKHLAGHLNRLPREDRRSRAIVEHMKKDEARHASHAEEAGGSRLPLPLRLAMMATSRLMTGSTYWV